MCLAHVKYNYLISFEQFIYIYTYSVKQYIVCAIALDNMLEFYWQMPSISDNLFGPVFSVSVENTVVQILYKYMWCTRAKSNQALSGVVFIYIFYSSTLADWRECVKRNTQHLGELFRI